MQRVEGEERSAKLKTSWSHHMANADDLLAGVFTCRIQDVISQTKKKNEESKMQILLVLIYAKSMRIASFRLLIF